MSEPISGTSHREVSNREPVAGQGTGDSRVPRASNDGIATSTLAAYEVRESAFSDFGMSVKTNFEVKWGGNIEWMVVTGVAAGSSASRMKIALGDRILAIDGRKITEMDRDAMLDALFQRKKGDRSRLLVLGHREALPRFLIVIANRPEP